MKYLVTVKIENTLEVTEEDFKELVSCVNRRRENWLDKMHDQSNAAKESELSLPLRQKFCELGKLFSQGKLSLDLTF